MYRRESRHTGEPLPSRTLAQILVDPTRMPPDLHVQGATVDFSDVWTEDHYCPRVHCTDTFNPLIQAGAGPGGRVAAVSLIERLPGDVGEQRHPFDPFDPVIEGQVLPAGLSAYQVEQLRRHGIRVDERTLVIQRAALHGRVPGPSFVDELVPFLLCLPVAVVTGLLSIVTRRSSGRAGPAPVRKRRR